MGPATRGEYVISSSQVEDDAKDPRQPLGRRCDAPGPIRVVAEMVAGCTPPLTSWTRTLALDPAAVGGSATSVGPPVQLRTPPPTARLRPAKAMTIGGPPTEVITLRAPVSSLGATAV